MLTSGYDAYFRQLTVNNLIEWYSTLIEGFVETLRFVYSSVLLMFGVQSILHLVHIFSFYIMIELYNNERPNCLISWHGVWFGRKKVIC